MNGASELERGRDAYAKRAWLDAYEALANADRTEPLQTDDLQLLATAAGMVGRMDDHLALLERLHHAYLDAGETLRAARAAFWVGMNLALSGAAGPAGGWFARTQRLVEREPGESAEFGYLQIPVAFRHQVSGDYDAAYAAATTAAEIAERFDDADLFAIAVHVQGVARIGQGRAAEGLQLLDGAMVGVTAGEVSPTISGVVYCGVIAGCETAFEPRRAREKIRAHLGLDKPAGGIFHVAGPSPNGGWRVIEVWESEEAANRFFEERFFPALRELGLSGPPPKRELWPVHNAMK